MYIKSYTGWPSQLLTTDHVDVKVVNTLTAFFPVINDSTISRFGEALLFSNLCTHNHQVPKKLLVSLFSRRNSGEAVSIFWNDQKVSLCNWCYITECKTLLIFIDNCGWNLFFDNLIKNCDFLCSSCLGFSLFTLHIFLN